MWRSSKVAKLRLDLPAEFATAARPRRKSTTGAGRRRPATIRRPTSSVLPRDITRFVNQEWITSDGHSERNLRQRQHPPVDAAVLPVRYLVLPAGRDLRRHLPRPRHFGRGEGTLGHLRRGASL